MGKRKSAYKTVGGSRPATAAAAARRDDNMDDDDEPFQTQLPTAYEEPEEDKEEEEQPNDNEEEAETIEAPKKPSSTPESTAMVATRRASNRRLAATRSAANTALLNSRKSPPASTTIANSNSAAAESTMTMSTRKKPPPSSSQQRASPRKAATSKSSIEGLEAATPLSRIDENDPNDEADEDDDDDAAIAAAATMTALSKDTSSSPQPTNTSKTAAAAAALQRMLEGGENDDDNADKDDAMRQGGVDDDGEEEDDDETETVEACRAKKTTASADQDGNDDDDEEDDDEEDDDDNRKPAAVPKRRPTNEAAATKKAPPTRHAPSNTGSTRHGTSSRATREETEGTEQMERAGKNNNNGNVHLTAAWSQDEYRSMAEQHVDQLIFDLIENEQERLMADASARRIHWYALLDLLDMYTHSKLEYGRIYVRKKLCGLLVDVCTHPNESEPFMQRYVPQDWDELLEDLESTRHACLRNDCTVRAPLDAVDPIKREDRGTLSSFSEKYRKVRNACLVNARLAPIRAKLHHQVFEQEHERTDVPPKLNTSKIQKMLKEVRDCDNTTVQQFVYKLFVPDDSADSAGEAPPFPTFQMKNLEDLANILSERPFDLEWLESKIVSMVDAWDDVCFGEYTPNLTKLNYQGLALTRAYHQPSQHRAKKRLPRQTTPQSQKKRRAGAIESSPSRNVARGVALDLEALARNRTALRDDHGEDPLETSRELAEQATGVARRAGGGGGGRLQKKARVEKETSNERDDEPDENNVPMSTDTAQSKASSRTKVYRKKSGTRLTFDDSDDDDNGDEGWLPDRVRLGDVPDRADATLDDDAGGGRDGGAAMAKTYIGPPPDEGVFDECGNVVKRHPWQVEEIDALIAGVEKHGPGKWVQIKNEYGHILRNRNSVQLKDKFRNLKLNKDLPERYL